MGELYNAKDQFVLIAAFHQGNPITNKCVKIFNDGSIYRGSVNEQLLLEGHGELDRKIFSYVGQFKEDVFHGEGKYTIG